MKWLIVEDALRDRKGHWLEYVSTFVRGLKELGDEVTVLCDRKAEVFIMEQTGAKPLLPESIWHRMGDGAGALRRYARVPGHAFATFIALRRFFRSLNHGEHGGGGGEVSQGEMASPPDWIFVPTVLVHHLLGWRILLTTGSVPRNSRVVLFFPNLPIHLDNAGRAFWNGGPTTKLMAWLLAQLRKGVDSGRVVLGVETHAMRLALESLIGMRVAYLPHPVEFHAETRRRGGEESPTALTTEDTESTEDCFVQKQSCAWSSQTGPSEPDSLASKPADSSISQSPTRSATAPASLPSTSYPLPATAAKPIVFGCYGAARWEKGSDIFQEAIRLILDGVISTKNNAKGGEQIKPWKTRIDTPEGRPIHFAIQWVEDFQDEKGNFVALDPLLKNHPQVDVIDRYFQGDEYERCLEQTDVMVLPYRSPYRLRVSRVVIEAMMHGMPVIATKATTLFEQAQEFGTVVACDGADAKSLAEAIWNLVTDFERMQHEAHRKSEIARTKFSVKYFRGSLIKFSSPRLHFFENN